MHAEHVDVLIVGAGLSGVGAGYHLQANCPRKTYAILEARDAVGGTWDLFRYPGIRSDSDMFTLGYSFRPWKEAKAIADGPSILDYVRDTAREYGIDRQIRFGHRVVRGRVVDATTRGGRSRSSGSRRGETIQLTCELPVRLQRLLPLRRAATRPTSRAPSASPARSSTRRLARGPRLRGQARGGDRQRRDRGDARARDGRARRARDDAPALAELRRLAAGRRPARQVRCAASSRRRLAYSVVRWKNVLMTMLVFQLSRRRPAIRQAADPPGRRAPAAARLRRRHALQPDATTRGTSACAWSPTATCSRRSATAARVVVTDRIDDLHRERAGARARARSSRPTSSSPPPGSNLLAARRHRPHRRRRARRPAGDDGLQGDDAERRAQHGDLRSATRTPPGRSSATSPASTCAACSTTWSAPATPTARRSTATRR